MTVRELITRLLDEDMDAEVMLQTHDAEYEKKNDVSGLCFHIDNVERWGGKPYINFTDWRNK